jgi:hypothetical protein
MAAIRQGKDTLQRLSLLEGIINRFPSGIILLEQDRILLVNSPAALALSLGANPIGATLRLEGPSGALIERVHEAARSEKAFLWHIPASESQLERVLQIEVVALGQNQFLLRIDDYSGQYRAAMRANDVLNRAVHDFKNPVAVLSLGLSNLQTYIERMSIEDRQAVLDELVEQVNEMNDVLARLYRQLKTDGRLTVSA